MRNATSNINTRIATNFIENHEKDDIRDYISSTTPYKSSNIKVKVRQQEKSKMRCADLSPILLRSWLTLWNTFKNNSVKCHDRFPHVLHAVQHPSLQLLTQCMTEWQVPWTNSKHKSRYSKGNPLKFWGQLPQTSLNPTAAVLFWVGLPPKTSIMWNSLLKSVNFVYFAFRNYKNS